MTSDTANKRKEEARLVESIRATTKAHWNSVVLPKLKANSSNLKESDYRAEINILTSLSQFGLAEGTIAFAASLFVMRTIMPRLVTRFNAVVTPRSEGIPKKNPFHTITPTEQQRTVPLPDTPSIKGARLLLDISFSLLAGAYAAMYLVDRSDMYRQLSQVPLVSGRSILADEFCGLLQTFIAARPPNYWKQAENVFLTEAYHFSVNCDKRQAMVKQLKQDLGLQEQDETPIIPTGGVPVLDSIEEKEDNWSQQGEYDDWAQGFVIDQSEGQSTNS